MTTWLKYTAHTLRVGGLSLVFACCLCIGSVVVVAVTAMITGAAQSTIQRMGASAFAVVFLRTDTAIAAQEVSARIVKDHVDVRVEVIAPEQALARASRSRSEDAARFAGLRMPWVLEVRPPTAGFAAGAREALLTTLRSWPETDEVVQPDADMQRFDAALRVVANASWLLWLLLAGATLAAMTTSLRLALQLRRDEIILQHELGASTWFVAIPVVMAGALVGFMAGLVGTGITAAAVALWERSAFARDAHIDLQQDPTLVVLLVVVGALLGAAAGAWSVFTTLRRWR
jgi:cell division protein FtsX